jgi:hypothetical protein
MAKAKRKGKGRLRGLGNLKSGAIGDILPSGLGLGAGGGTTLALYALVPPTGTISEKVNKFAPVIGTVVGGFGAMGIAAMGGRSTQAASAFVHALVGSLLVWGARKLFVAPAQTVAIDGLGNVVVPQLGATVLEQLNGVRGGLRGNNQDQGEVVQLSGTVQTNAFGQKAYD